MNQKVYQLLGIYDSDLKNEADIYINMSIEYLKNADVKKDELNEVYVVAVAMLTKAFFDNEIDELPNFFNALINQLKLVVPNEIDTGVSDEI